jgi:hypothetical protein
MVCIMNQKHNLDLHAKLKTLISLANCRENNLDLNLRIAVKRGTIFQTNRTHPVEIHPSSNV